jgi:hypothetical protein
MKECKAFFIGQCISKLDQGSLSGGHHLNSVTMSWVVEGEYLDPVGRK